MIVTKDEAKAYLRIDGTEDDAMIDQMLPAAEQTVKDVSRLSDEAIAASENVGLIRVAILYTLSYLFDHREDANYTELALMIRSLLFGVREVRF